MVLMVFKGRKLRREKNSFFLNIPAEYVQAFGAKKGETFFVGWESASGLLMVYPRLRNEQAFDKLRLIEYYFKELDELAIRQAVYQRTHEKQSGGGA